MSPPSSAVSGIISPEAQKRVPSLRMCQRSSGALPASAARRFSTAGRSPARSSGVKNASTVRPSISASVQPRMRSAPVFQRVTRPWGSIATIA
ncbi:hypothetical protein OFEAOIEE_LOCUS1418 [Methylorubrum extorquens]